MDAAAPKRRKFVAAGNRPDPALVARQMEVTAIAYKALESVEAARRYLNEDDDALGGRPIDVAGASAEGLQRVSQALTRRL